MNAREKPLRVLCRGWVGVGFGSQLLGMLHEEASATCVTSPLCRRARSWSSSAAIAACGGRARPDKAPRPRGNPKDRGAWRTPVSVGPGRFERVSLGPFLRYIRFSPPRGRRRAQQPIHHHRQPHARGFHGLAEDDLLPHAVGFTQGMEQPRRHARRVRAKGDPVPRAKAWMSPPASA